jgi:hypothetical protein
LQTSAKVGGQLSDLFHGVLRIVWNASTVHEPVALSIHRLIQNVRARAL